MLKASRRLVYDEFGENAEAEDAVTGAGTKLEEPAGLCVEGSADVDRFLWRKSPKGVVS